MKKILLSSLIVTSIFAFGYTQIDVDNATYLAGKGIITTQSTTAAYRFDDTITRAEVAGIALKLKGINLPENYQCRKYFSDVTKNDWICRAVEIAADARFISRTNTAFRPQDKITRAEALAIIMKAGGLSVHNIPGYDDGIDFAYSFDTSVRWQIEVLFTGVELGIFDTTKLSYKTVGDPEIRTMRIYNFYPDKAATRSEVFGFAKNILEYRATMSGEIMMDSQNRTIEK